MSQSLNYPLSTVGGLIFAADGEILLVRSKKWLGCYSLPGGKIELGETREQAFIREIKEETALTITQVCHAITQDSIFSPEFWKPNHFVMHDFTAKLAKESDKAHVILNEEADAFLWLSPQQALRLRLNRESIALLNWYQDNQTFN